MTRNIFRDNADKYVLHCWSIFPLVEGEKIPLKGTDGFKSASTNGAQVAAWAKQHPHANIGIATGKSSGIVVIDMDPRSGCNETLARLAKERKVFGDTVTTISPRDGRHLYFAYDQRVTTSKANALGPGIDIKTDGGYIVAPPSFWRRNGKAYKWLRPLRGAELPRLPRWVIDALQPKPEPISRPTLSIEFGNLTGYRRQALSDLNTAVHMMATLQDGRHEAPFKAASALGKYVHHKLLSATDMEAAIIDACSHNGALGKYTLSDIKRQIRNGLCRASTDALPPLARVHRDSQIVSDNLHMHCVRKDEVRGTDPLPEEHVDG